MSSCCLAINDCRHNNESSKGSSSMIYLYFGKNSDFDTKDPSLHQFSGLVSFHHDHILSPYLCLNVSDRSDLLGTAVIQSSTKRLVKTL